MTAPWSPVIAVDIIGSSLMVVIAVWCAWLAWDWTCKKTDDVFRHYIYLLTMAIVFFAVSRSVGHLFKQLLILNDMSGTWKQLAPFSGAINSATFIVIFAFGLYFQRFQKVHLELEAHKNNLELLIEERTAELENAVRSQQNENKVRRLAEEDLRQSKTALETIFNSSNPICITTIDFEVMQANNAYYGVWPAQVRPGPVKCYESRPGSVCHTDQCPLTQIIKGAGEVMLEVEKTEPDGKTIYFIVTARPYRDADGRLIGIVENFQDISARKFAEEDLASERERLAVTLRSIGDGVITTDTGGKVMMINKIAEQLTGWSQQEALGRPLPEIFRIINEKDRTPCVNPVDKVMTTGQIIGLANHTALIARDGTERSIADSGAPIRDKESRIIGVVLVFRDITAQVKMEKELLKVKKLESVGVLAGGIAHDFNNILVAILGNINIATELISPDHESYPLLLEAEKASLRARDLTLQLLTFSKGGEPVRETASLPEVIKDSAEFILHGEKIALVYNMPDNLSLVDIDKGQMSQVIQNIIMNATHAMPDGGIIQISCENVNRADLDEEIPLVGDGNFVRITISDKGIGIPAKDIDKIFDPYFSTKRGGSGLGLAVTHSIVSKHFGHITVHSKPGQGATFKIYLPASDKTLLPKENIAAKPLPEKAKILIMDDEEDVRQTVQVMLEHLGFEVLLAADGTEAIAMYTEARDANAPFDLIIMDLTIPGAMGGKTAVKKILAIEPLAKVIVSSGYSNDPIMANFTEYGFCASIVKPYQVRDLLDVVQRALA